MKSLLKEIIFTAKTPRAQRFLSEVGKHYSKHSRYVTKRVLEELSEGVGLEIGELA